MTTPTLREAAPTGGSPEHLLQDQSRELSRALAGKPDAPMHAREAAALHTAVRLVLDATPEQLPMALDALRDHFPDAGNKVAHPHAHELAAALGWPGHWTRVAPRVEDHPQGAELAWMARGYPFNRPVLARSNVGVKRAPTWVAMEPQYEQFVRVELMADSFHGQDASAFGWFRDLEWLGPLVLPNAAANRTP